MASLSNTRITRRFAALKQAGRAGLVTFVTAGDPDLKTFRDILHGMPKAGGDIIEIGVPFSDPMADGPSVQLSSQRALKHRTSLKQVLAEVAAFRAADAETPIVLMGYFNPIYRYGCEAFARDAAKSGVDGAIVVDLPPEEADELHPHLAAHGVHMIFLTAPTSTDERLPAILSRSSGFVYYVSVAGVTGTKQADERHVQAAVARLKRHTRLPIAVGFGIKSPEAARAIGRHCDAVVVGSAIVDVIARGGTSAQVIDFVKDLARK
jgi:tryptophan synthase alpha chain